MDNVEKIFPDRISPIAKQAIDALHGIQSQLQDAIPAAFWGGFWHGLVTASLVVILLIIATGGKK